MNRCCVCDRPATKTTKHGEPMCSVCYKSSLETEQAIQSAPPRVAPRFDSSDPARDMRQEEAYAVCSARGHVWITGTMDKNRNMVGPHVRGDRSSGSLSWEVGYAWSTRYSHYASGTVYHQIMGRGPTLADALIAAEKRHTANMIRVAKAAAR